MSDLLADISVCTAVKIGSWEDTFGVLIQHTVEHIEVRAPFI
jgi:hypothetical protein